MAPGEIHLARFPYGGSAETKLRPVLLLTSPIGPVPEILCAYISSELPLTLLSTDILLDPHLPEHASTNLKAVSVVRLHKLATLHRRSFVRVLGSVSVATMAEVSVRLRSLLML
jgi:mRNA-degrading endonuclease toxin of MazEF toxin-antitoxin module